MSRRPSKNVRGSKQLEALSRRERMAHTRALEAVSLMRRQRLTVREAARRAGTTPRTVQHYAGSALERRGHRIRAKRGDNLIARMPVLTSHGPRDLDVKGSRNRSLVGQHWNAVADYLHSGNTDQLEPLAGKHVSGFDLLTDIDEIDYWAPREPFNFEEIYDLTR